MSSGDDFYIDVPLAKCGNFLLLVNRKLQNVKTYKNMNKKKKKLLSLFQSPSSGIIKNSTDTFHLILSVPLAHNKILLNKYAEANDRVLRQKSQSKSLYIFSCQFSTTHSLTTYP